MLLLPHLCAQTHYACNMQAHTSFMCWIRFFLTFEQYGTSWFASSQLMQSQRCSWFTINTQLYILEFFMCVWPWEIHRDVVLTLLYKQHLLLTVLMWATWKFISEIFTRVSGSLLKPRASKLVTFLAVPLECFFFFFCFLSTNTTERSFCYRPGCICTQHLSWLN